MISSDDVEGDWFIGDDDKAQLLLSVADWSCSMCSIAFCYLVSHCINSQQFVLVL